MHRGRRLSFNLAIEMLFISGWYSKIVSTCTIVVSISQSRCFSFQVASVRETPGAIDGVSISQSRCFSFQACQAVSSADHSACSFYLAIEMLFISGRNLSMQGHGLLKVSISQSRCFSFQATRAAERAESQDAGFNLAIEMLFISGSMA